MARKYEHASALGLEIRGEVVKTGYSDDEAAAVIGVSKTAWQHRIHDPGLFRAREIKQLRRIIPDAVCDKISR